MSEYKPGTYKARAVPGSFQRNLTKNGHPEYIVDVFVPDLGNTFQVHLSMSGGAIPITLDSLEAMGHDGQKIEGQPVGLGTVDCEICLSYRMWEGKSILNISIRTSGSRFVAPPLSAAAEASFLALERNAIGSRRAKNPIQASAQKEDKKDVGSDDIPF